MSKEVIPGPTHQLQDFTRYEPECRETLKPLLAKLLDDIVTAGWDRRTAASALMFLAAHQIPKTPEN